MSANQGYAVTWELSGKLLFQSSVGAPQALLENDGASLRQPAGLLEPHVRLSKVNTEAEPALGARYNIRSIPTLALFRDGREVAQQFGAMTVQDIVRWVQSR